MEIYLLMMEKIFGIGFHKTGTCSLKQALVKLGYKVKGPYPKKRWSGQSVEEVLNVLENFDACEDNPWPVLYKELDKKYPKSKFILVIRDTDEWIKSVIRSFGGKNTLMRRWIYGKAHGDPIGNQKIYTEKYEKHNKEVQEYFKDRPEDLLVLRLEDDDKTKWESLCSFLGKKITSHKFSVKNKKRK